MKKEDISILLKSGHFYLGLTEVIYTKTGRRIGDLSKLSINQATYLCVRWHPFRLSGETSYLLEC